MVVIKLSVSNGSGKDGGRTANIKNSKLLATQVVQAARFNQPVFFKDMAKAAVPRYTSAAASILT